MNKKFVLIRIETLNTVVELKEVFDTEKEAHARMKADLKEYEDDADRCGYNSIDTYLGDTTAHFNDGGEYWWLWFIIEVDLDTENTVEKEHQHTLDMMKKGTWTVDYAKGHFNAFLEQKLKANEITFEEYQSYVK